MVSVMSSNEKAPVEPFPLDPKDKEIMDILQENPEISYADLAKKVNMAASSVHNRVKKLVDAKMIDKGITIVDPFKVGFDTIALVGMKVEPSKMNEIAKTIASFNKVQMIGTTTGDHDIVFRVIAENDKALWRFINEKIKTIPGVKSEMDVSSFIDFFKRSQRIHFDE